LANGQQAASTINLKYSYHACKQIIVFKNNINRLLFIIILSHLTAENAVMEVISLVGDIRGQHVGKVGTQG
jgi:hypothetical protein